VNGRVGLTGTEGRDLFRMEQQRTADGEVRLTLVGELDLAVAPDFVERIASLRAEAVPVRIDLRGLEFLDSTGLRELIVAVTEARRSGWSLQLEPELDGEVARIIDLVGARSFFWPD
jgi:anti-anti-sigma factor